MSLFGKFFRSAAVTGCVAIGSSSVAAQQPVAAPPTVLELSGVPGVDPVTPASGFGRGPRSAPACPPAPYYPCPPAPQHSNPPPTDPLTGPPVQPMMPPMPGMGTAPARQPDPEVADIGFRPSGADVGSVVGLGGYIENAAPVTMARLRFDAGYGNNRPDRGEFFYAKCGCFRPQPGSNGPPLPARNVDYQELISTAQFALSQRLAVFADVPVRFINPESNQNAAGISDIGFGAKYAFISNEHRIVSFMLRFQAPAGSLSLGLGNGNWWVEPGLLYQEQLSARWQLFGELRFQAPLGTRSDFTGNLLRTGLGTSYVVAQGRWGYVAPVLEMVGWTVLSGKELNPDGLVAKGAAGDTIVNAKFGVRIGLGAPTLGSPYPTRSDLYIGYGRALTGEVWYKDLLRVEYRLFY